LSGRSEIHKIHPIVRRDVHEEAQSIVIDDLVVVDVVVVDTDDIPIIDDTERELREGKSCVIEKGSPVVVGYVDAVIRIKTCRAEQYLSVRRDGHRIDRVLIQIQSIGGDVCPRSVER
jgi:hypothetical protein